MPLKSLIKKLWDFDIKCFCQYWSGSKILDDHGFVWQYYSLSEISLGCGCAAVDLIRAGQ
jgi:hypothetical protein